MNARCLKFCPPQGYVRDFFDREARQLDQEEIAQYDAFASAFVPITPATVAMRNAGTVHIGVC